MLDYKNLFDDIDNKKEGKELAKDLIMVGRAMSNAGQWYQKTLYQQDIEMEKKAERERKAALGHGYRKKKKTVEEVERELNELLSQREKMKV